MRELKEKCARTMVEPTATLILSVSWSFTETLIAVTHSAMQKVSGNSSCEGSPQELPAMELTVGKRMSPIHSLLIVGDK